MTMLNFSFIFSFLLVSVLFNGVYNYRAVVVIHGVLTGSESMQLISDRIQAVSVYFYKQDASDVAPARISEVKH